MRTAARVFVAGTLAVAIVGAAAAQENKAAADAPAIDGKTLESAGKFLDRYDADKNGTLEESEWSAMTVKPTDYNADQRVTKEELARRILEDRATRSGGSTPSATSPATATAAENAEKPAGAESGAADSAAANATQEHKEGDSAPLQSESTSSPRAERNQPARRSYRFLTPKERLPAGLPDFFASRDRDGDGQVMMFEFASRWTEATVREFAGYDLNNDGVITVSECLRRQKRDGR